jgi:hypothetical protein
MRNRVCARTLVSGQKMTVSDVWRGQPVWHPQSLPDLEACLAAARKYSLATIGQTPKRPSVWRKAVEHVCKRVKDYLASGCVRVRAGAKGLIHIYYGTQSCTASYVYDPAKDSEHDGHGHIQIIPKGSVYYSRPFGGTHGVHNCHKRNRR